MGEVRSQLEPSLAAGLFQRGKAQIPAGAVS